MEAPPSIRTRTSKALEALIRSSRNLCFWGCQGCKVAGSTIKTRPRAKPSKEGLKVKWLLQTAVKVFERLSWKANRTKEEEERLPWFKEKMEEDRGLMFGNWFV